MNPQSSFEKAVAVCQPPDRNLAKNMIQTAAQYGLQAEVAKSFTEALLIHGCTVPEAVSHALREWDL